MKRCWCGAEVETTDITTQHGELARVVLSCSASEFHVWDATGRPLKIERLYVAGPMTGYPDCNYPLFNQVADTLAAGGYEVVNPATAVVGTEAHYVDFIREDLRMMLDCQGVAVLENWWESAGARNEVQVAGLLKMPVRTWQDWMVRAEHEAIVRNEGKPLCPPPAKSNSAWMPSGRKH